jgi:multisubunit Na+/H+ antiporter MnhB subunit
MSVALLLDAGLAALVVVVAVSIIAARQAFAAVIGFVTYGLLLAIVWVRLGAVDVALTEAAIGSGLTGGLLIGAASRLRAAEARATTRRPGRSLRLAAAILSAGISAGLAAIVLSPPEPAPTLAAAAVAGLPAIDVGNAVTAVLLAYRAWDTLLEKVVLLPALVGVWSLAPDLVWGGRPGPRYRSLDQSPLALLTQLLAPVGIVVGVYMVWAGSDQPGGAFPGGTIIAAMWILAMMAGLADAPAIRGRGVRWVLVGGPAVFLAIGLAGFAVAGAFLAYPAGYAKPLILIIEGPLTLSIAATLALLVAGPPARTEEIG